MDTPTELIPHAEDHDPQLEYWHCTECARLRRGDFTPLFDGEDAWLHRVTPAPTHRPPDRRPPAKIMQAEGVPGLFDGLEDQ